MLILLYSIWLKCLTLTNFTARLKLEQFCHLKLQSQYQSSCSGRDSSAATSKVCKRFHWCGGTIPLVLIFVCNPQGLRCPNCFVLQALYLWSKTPFCFKTAQGSFSYISPIAPEFGVTAVNLSCGYHHAHTLHEYINHKELDEIIGKVIDIINDASNLPNLVVNLQRQSYFLLSSLNCVNQELLQD